MCFSTLEDFSFDCSALSPTGTGYVQRTATMYDTACRACEITVAPDRPTVELMRQALHYEKTKQGPAGRALLNDDFHHLGLRLRDRLEPTRGLPMLATSSFADCLFLQHSGGEAVRRQHDTETQSLGRPPA